MNRLAIITATAALAVAALSGCGNNKSCLVIDNGNKVCGDDAVTYCQATDLARQRTINALHAVGDYLTAAQYEGNQATCNDLEGS